MEKTIEELRRTVRELRLEVSQLRVKLGARTTVEFRTLAEYQHELRED